MQLTMARPTGKHRWLFVIQQIVSLCLVIGCSSQDLRGSKPHIIFLLADDLGWYDVSWHNPKAHTPNLEKLAKEGIILEQSYVQPVCTPTRSALLSGRYPFTIGRQGPPLMNDMPTGLLLNATLLPETLRDAGYSTHMVGKWHLGFCHWDYTPTYRGFDTFFGYYTGYEDHYTRESYSGMWEHGMAGYDFRDNESPYFRNNGTYGTLVFADQIKQILQGRNPDDPLFLYVAFQTIHNPTQVPDEYREPFSYVGNESREIGLGMGSAMDEAVGKIISDLKETGHYENSVIIFSSDNGANETIGNNYPLRGGKNTTWEGGQRAAGFIHSPLLNKTGFISQTLFHVTDWYPTLVGLAGGDDPEITDGFDQWEALTEGTQSPRTTLVYNIVKVHTSDSLTGAIRKGDYKLGLGYMGRGGWRMPPEGVNDSRIKRSPEEYGRQDEEDLKDDPGILLFNLIEDPEERNNIADSNPDIVKDLMEEINKEAQRLVPFDDPEGDPTSNPVNYGGVWSPGWCDPYEY